MFSKGFTNIVLHESSSFLTTMHSPLWEIPVVAYAFGVSLRPEEYPRRQHRVLEGLKRVINMADDISVFRSGT